MGIPSFSRWLYEKYSKCIVPVVDHCSSDAKGNIVLPDASLPNPNGIEFDNFYIDMNGLVHPCCHPEDGVLPKDEPEMFRRINEYFLYMVSIVRPRKLLFVALDGVAPRAKMNQQRSRRFKTAKERAELDSSADRRGSAPTWDHNAITPGTPFMAELSRQLRRFITLQLETNAAWKELRVVFSDSSVPGEGEHKIMGYIRAQRQVEGYDPHTRHCVHGLDADLFHLALATHEENFSILREDVLLPKNVPKVVCCGVCGSKQHAEKDCSVKKMNPTNTADKKTFKFAHIYILREYLYKELSGQCPRGWDFERAIDDFIFLCFFVGNDFLPHLPTLQIREGAIDMLLGIYREEFVRYGIYLTNKGVIDFENLKFLLTKISKIEQAVLIKQEEGRKYFAQMRKTKAAAAQNPLNTKSAADDLLAAKSASQTAPPPAAASAQTETQSMLRRRASRFLGPAQPPAETTPVSSRWIPAYLRQLLSKILPAQTLPAKHSPEVPDTAHIPLDPSRGGWGERYYRFKFGRALNPKKPPRELLEVFGGYLSGLQWVFGYYNGGECPSWEWFYPHYYAPLARELARLQKWGRTPRAGQPLSPLAQLMAVMPPSSRHCLPRELRALMVAADSPVADFYPESFRLDLDGKRFAWQGVALLPFIDAGRLVAALKPRLRTLPPAGAALDASGCTALFVHRRSRFAKSFGAEARFAVGEKLALARCFEGNFSGGLEVSERGAEVLCFRYDAPKALDAQLRHRLLPGARVPPPVLSAADISKLFFSRRFGAFSASRTLRFAPREVVSEFSRYGAPFERRAGARHFASGARPDDCYVGPGAFSPSPQRSRLRSPGRTHFGTGPVRRKAMNGIRRGLKYRKVCFR